MRPASDDVVEGGMESCGGPISRGHAGGQHTVEVYSVISIKITGWAGEIRRDRTH